jgi:hypothetical protein
MNRVDGIWTLYHEACMPYKLEFVYRPTACNASSILQREPRKFGKYENGEYSTKKVSDKFVNADQSSIPMNETRLEVFHKLCLIEKENGSCDMVPESEAKKDRRYFTEKGENTQFAHPDPMLIPIPSSRDFWFVYDQKKPLDQKQEQLAMINRTSGTLFDSNGREVRKMNKDEFVSFEEELYMLSQTQTIMDIISAASLMTNLRKTDFGPNGDIVFGDILGRAFVADGKVEFGLTKAGRIKLTDDMVTDNFRMFLNGISTLSAKRLFQNDENEDGKLKVIRMYEEATRMWKEQRFVDCVNYVLNLGKKR